MSTRKLLSWILIGTAAALAVGGGVVVARRLVSEGRTNPSRIIDGCERMLTRLERKLAEGGRAASVLHSGS
jgi:hypothetical protein